MLDLLGVGLVGLVRIKVMTALTFRPRYPGTGQDEHIFRHWSSYPSLVSWSIGLFDPFDNAMEGLSIGGIRWHLVAFGNDCHK